MLTLKQFPTMIFRLLIRNFPWGVSLIFGQLQRMLLQLSILRQLSNLRQTRKNKCETIHGEAENVGKGNWRKDVNERKIPFKAKGKSQTIVENEMTVIQECCGKSPHKIYARQKNDLNFTLDENMLNIFVAILMFTGYHTLPHQHLYWEQEPDTGIETVYNAMSRKEFESIKKYIHFCDNTNLNVKDKFAKVRKLFDIINTKIQQFGFFHSSYCIQGVMGASRQYM